MIDNQYVSIVPLGFIGADDRGKTYDFSLQGRSNYILISRKAGSMSGNSYHHGKRSATNPKVMILLGGEAHLLYRHIDDKEHQKVHLKEPVIIKIEPFVTHAMLAITDFMMLEGNGLLDLKDDRFFEDVVLT